MTYFEFSLIAGTSITTRVASEDASMRGSSSSSRILVTNTGLILVLFRTVAISSSVGETISIQQPSSIMSVLEIF